MTARALAGLGASLLFGLMTLHHSGPSRAQTPEEARAELNRLDSILADAEDNRKRQQAIYQNTLKQAQQSGISALEQDDEAALKAFSFFKKTRSIAQLASKAGKGQLSLLDYASALDDAKDVLNINPFTNWSKASDLKSKASSLLAEARQQKAALARSRLSTDLMYLQRDHKATEWMGRGLIPKGFPIRDYRDGRAEAAFWGDGRPQFPKDNRWRLRETGVPSRGERYPNMDPSCDIAATDGNEISVIAQHRLAALGPIRQWCNVALGQYSPLHNLLRIGVQCRTGGIGGAGSYSTIDLKHSGNDVVIVITSSSDLLTHHSQPT